MILIDEYAEQELLTLLETFRLSPEHRTRCIHFQFENKEATAGLREVLIASAQKHLHASESKIFFCDMGDIVLLAEPLASRDGNLVILDVVNHINKPANQSWVTFDELSRQVYSLLNRITPVLDAQHKAEEETRRLQEERQLARKRQTILSNGAHANSSEIQRRRNTRQKPELMMIEDDSFSRRLVENVLQKKYALTSLADANHALDTYARIAPDLLFLDINLPDVTGHELLERLLTIDPEAHVIMLSGNADQANIVEAMRKGAKGFIAKPFTKEKLFQYIERCAGITKKQHSVTA